MALPPTMSTQSPQNLLLIGGGPRTVSQTTAEVIFQYLYSHHFDALHDLGAEYHMRTTIIEQQSHLGVGNSFCHGQTGMMNSGIENDITFPLPHPQREATGEDTRRTALLSYRTRYEQMLTGREKEYYRQVLPVNLPGAVMFQRSLGARSTTPAGQFDHSGAYLMRTTVGEEEYKSFAKVQQLAEKLPYYRLDIMPSSFVKRVAIDPCGRHQVHVNRLDLDTVEKVNAGMIRLNTGTTTTNPIPDPEVRKIAFCTYMNAHNFRRYCEKRQLLGRDDLLRPGVKILSGGVNLSGLDQISVLNHVMNLFEEDEGSLLGYRVSEEAKQRYQGAITLVSRTPGKVVQPRHATGFEWSQGTPVIGGTKNLHALFLHNYGEHVFDMWVDILKANVARASYRTPADVTHVADTIKGALRVQYKETRWFLECRKKAEREEKKGNMEGKQQFVKESSKTLYAAWRQAALSLMFGFGLEEDGKSATNEMHQYAPLTWKGREFWLFVRARLKALSDTKFAKQSNAALIKNINMLMQHITSSPVEIHSMLHLLTEAGIARHKRACYADIHTDGDKLLFQGGEYNGLLVSPVFERSENDVIKSLAGQVKPYDEGNPTYGQVGKFRRLVDNDGKSTSIEDNGLSGMGFWVDANSGKSLVGSFAMDVNNRASAVSIVSSCTLRRMAVAHLHAAGIENPNAVLEDLYEMVKPEKNEFEEEVSKFKVHFEDAFEMWAYLEGIKHMAGDDAEYYKILFDGGLTRKDRKEQMRMMSTSGLPREREAHAVYRTKLNEMPEFRPPTRDEYYARFVDTTVDEDKFIYETAYDMARRHLEARPKC